MFHALVFLFALPAWAGSPPRDVGVAAPTAEISGRKVALVVGNGAYRNTGQGACDMAGNVWELVEDVNGSYQPNVTDPVVEDGDPGRVYRGGSWRYTPGFVRVACRDWVDPSIRTLDLGFRLSRSNP